MSRLSRPPHRWAIPLITVLLIVLVALAYPVPVFAAGAVGTGSAASCTEAAFEAVLAGGGLVTFNCGPNPTIILLSSMKAIAQDTEIRGGGSISLSGANTTSLFQVYAGVSLTLDRLTLTRAGGTFGAVENFGTLVGSGITISDSVASSSGGAINNYGTLTLTNVTLSGNTAAGSGGAIFNDSGTVTIAGSRLLDNNAGGNGGGISSVNGSVNLSDTRVEGNRGLSTDSVPYSRGGGIYSSDNLVVVGSTVALNVAVDGGGIFSSGTLALTDVVLTGNKATYAGPASGGGLYATGTGTAVGMTFVGNSAGSYGGGIYVANTGTLEVDASDFTGNTATVGGAAQNQGRLSLTRSVVHANEGAAAPGVANGAAGLPVVGDLRLTNVTISGNTADFANAAGLSVHRGEAVVTYTTIFGNQGSTGVEQAGTGIVRLKNTIVAGNATQNCLGSITSEGHNFTGGANPCAFGQPSDRTAAEPMLGPLADNGGATLTHMPLAANPAIDGGQCVAGVAMDQRGAARPVGASCDIGAVEAGSTPPIPPAPRLMFLPLVLG